MSMPTYIQLIGAGEAIGTWFFWFVIHVIIVLAISAVAATLYLMNSNKNVRNNRIRNKRIRYVKSRSYNKRAV